jgi:N-acetylglucosamine kinase-like BadF-type ATPase
VVERLLLALEGGGTRSQAALLDGAGNVLRRQDSIAVNANFVPLDQAKRVVLELVSALLASYGAAGKDVTHFATSLAGVKFGAETFGSLCPNAKFYDVGELKVVFARAGVYQPHGVSLVAATGATVWGVRSDDGREIFLGGWGSLLGDEGSAYAMGLLGLRYAVRAFEQRAPAPTGLVTAMCQHFGVSQDHFRQELVKLVYQKPLSRAEIAGAAPVVTQLAGLDDPLAKMIVEKIVADLAALVRSAAGRLFTARELFDVAMAGGLINSGALIVEPLQQMLIESHPNITFKIGSAAPAEALGHLILHDIKEKAC